MKFLRRTLRNFAILAGAMCGCGALAWALITAFKALREPWSSILYAVTIVLIVSAAGAWVEHVTDQDDAI